MKKYVVFLIIFFSTISYGQGVGQMGWVAKFGLVAGIKPIWIVPDFSALNSVTKNFGVSQLPKSGMLVIGGSGKAEIDIYQNKGFLGWQSLWGEVSNSSKTTKNINRRLTNKYFTITPTLNVGISLNRFIAFRIGGGYLLPFNNTWKVDNDKELINTSGNLRLNSFSIQTGLFIGFFAF